jgi:uncharacterized protein YneR
MSNLRTRFFIKYGHEEHIGKGLNAELSYIRQEAIQHPNATKEHIDKALNDSDENNSSNKDLYANYHRNRNRICYAQ